MSDSVSYEEFRVSYVKIFSIAVISIFIAAVVFSGYTGRDDSHITYHVSDAIASKFQISNYNGDYIEQSSTFSFSYILGMVVYITGYEAATLGYFVSFACHLAAIAFAAFLVSRMDVNRIYVLVALMNPSTMYWSMSGMENSFYLLLILMTVFAIHAYARHGVMISLPSLVVLSFGVTLTRPEALFVVGAAMAGLLVVDRAARNRKALFVAVAAGVALAIGFRLAIGLDVFPNTVYAKQDLGLVERITDGLRYLRNTAYELPFSSVAAFLSFLYCAWAFLFSRIEGRMRTVVHALLAFTAAIGAFAFASGGDWMEAGRFLTVAFALQFLALFLVVAPRVKLPVAVICCICFVIDGNALVRSGFGGIPLYASYPYTTTQFEPSWLEHQNNIHARDLSFLDGLIETIETDDRASLTIASIQAGMVPYYLFRNTSKDLEFVDLRGLATDHVHPCRAGGGSNYWPYDDIEQLQDCVGRAFQYIYDLDGKDWNILQGLLEVGCTEIFREKLFVKTVSWKPAFETQQFLVRCH